MTTNNKEVEVLETSKEVLVSESELNKFNSFEAGKVIFSSLDSSTASKKLAYNAISTAVSLEKHIGEEIDAVHLIRQNVELTDEKTGEVQQKIRNIIIGKDGTAFSSPSSIVHENLNTIMGMYGEFPYNEEPLTIRATYRQTRNNNRALTLEVI